MTETTQIRVLLADDHALVRDGIRARLETVAHISVVGEAENGIEAVNKAADLDPDLIMLDVSMPLMNGLEATKELRKRCPAVKILVLSVYDNPEYVQGLVKLGANGYILKDVSLVEMINAIDSVANGGAYFSGKVTPTLLSDTGSETVDNPYGLTGRELEVLEQIALGKTNKEVARALDISVRTAETHRQNIREKVNGGNAADLTRVALELGLLGSG